MKTIDATGLDYKELNALLRETTGKCTIQNCCGQRYLADGMADIDLTIDGVPGNALGAYLNGAHIAVNGNAQDAVGDTMNAGQIVIHGSVGDTVGYAMRGGAIFVQGNAGYRAGIHMKAYQDKVPTIVIGGRAGSFLGEYQAGGVIVVLGLHDDGKPVVSNFPCTGMHGGKVIMRGDCSAIRFPQQVHVSAASQEDMDGILPFLKTYCALFGEELQALLAAPFTVVTPDSSNPFRQLYVAN